MAKPIKTKQCCKCKQFKLLSKFSKDHLQKDNHSPRCKICCSEIMKKYRQSEKGKAANKRYRQSKKGKEADRRGQRKFHQTEKGKIVCHKAQKQYNVLHPERRRARHAVEEAIKRGRLPNPDTLLCHYCPAQAQQYHHYLGYAPKYWLDIMPTCYKCHQKLR